MKSIRRIARFLLPLELWVVIGLVMASLVSASVLPFVAPVALLFWPLRWLAYQRITLSSPADIPIGVMFAMIPVTLWATAWRETTLPQVFRLLSGIGLYYAILNWTAGLARPQQRLRWLVWGMVLASLALALFALVSVQWVTSSKLPFIPAGLYAYLPPLVTDTANPNVMAGSLAILLTVIAALVLFGWGKLRQLELVILAFFAVVVSNILVLTQSRGGFMGLGVALVTLVVLRWRRGWLLAAGVLGVLAALAIGLGAGSLLNYALASTTLGGVEGRVEVWSRAVYMIQDFPFTGVGLGNFGRVADLLYPFFQYTPGTMEHSHNLFLQIAVDLGLPGLITWLAIWGLHSALSWQIYHQGQRSRDSWMAGLGAGLLASQLALIVHGQVDAVVWGMVRPAPLVWALWGIAVAGWYVSRPGRLSEKVPLT